MVNRYWACWTGSWEACPRTQLAAAPLLTLAGLPRACLQLFHLCVVVAACVHYKAVRVLLAWRDATGGCLPPLPADTLRPLPPLLSP